MTTTSEPSKALDMRKAPLQVLLDPGAAVSESEQEPTLGTHFRHIGGKPDAGYPTRAVNLRESVAWLVQATLFVLTVPIEGKPV
jgi:hypothetical protein